MAIPTNALLFQAGRGSGAKKVHARRFCMDDETDRTEFERLATEHINGRINFVGEQTEYYSQKNDRLYVFVKWAD